MQLVHLQGNVYYLNCFADQLCTDENNPAQNAPQIAPATNPKNAPPIVALTPGYKEVKNTNTPLLNQKKFIPQVSKSAARKR